MFLSGSASDVGVAEPAFLPYAPSSTFGVAPSTNPATPYGLPDEEASALGNMAQDKGDPDGVSRAPPSPTSTLITLAAAGRNPADITIPTQGSEADEDEGDDVVLASATPGSSASSTLVATSGSSTTSSSLSSSADSDVTPDDDPASSGSHEVPAGSAAAVPPPAQGGVGHHYAPISVIASPEVAARLSPKAMQLAAGYYSGPTYPSHRYSTPHADYNAYLKQKLIEYADYLAVNQLMRTRC